MTLDTLAHPTPERTAPSASDDLARLLADTFTLYLKTHGYHWNVTGPAFRSLHLMFEEQYTELQLATDEIAERIRVSGAQAPGSLRRMAALASIVEDDGAPPAMEMVRRLADDQSKVAATARLVLASAEAAGDAATVDLATRRIAVHEKARWMLEATLDR